MNAATLTDVHVKLSDAENDTLRQRSDLIGGLLVLHAWTVIGLAMYVFARWPNPLTFVICSAVIGGRQLGLSILMHDAAHRVLMRRTGLNDFTGHWLAGGAVGSHMYSYRPYHLTHHRHTQQDEDPDLVLSRPFPVTAGSLWRKVWRDLSGQTGFKQRLAQLRVGLGDEGSMLKRLQRLGHAEKAFALTNLVLFSVLWACDQLLVIIKSCNVVTIDQFNANLICRSNFIHNDFSVTDWKGVVVDTMKKLNRNGDFAQLWTSYIQHSKQFIGTL